MVPVAHRVTMEPKELKVREVWPVPTEGLDVPVKVEALVGPDKLVKLEESAKKEPVVKWVRPVMADRLDNLVLTV